MCGIIGTIGKEYQKNQIEQCAQQLHHRGPDATGIFSDDLAVLIHKRLSIIDLSVTANQPFTYKEWVVIFNGEIYNYEAVKNILTTKGYHFDTHSDTEVLVKAFHLWGIDCLQYFLGMFAFCIYNTQTHEMFLVRDRIGVKPLYYMLEDNNLTFASELKALIPLLTNKTISSKALTRYFQYGYTGNDQSIFEPVKKIPAGHYLHYTNGQASLVAYWQLKESTPANEPYEVTREKLQQLLTDAFSLRMVADVPVGVFLSGGIDSSLVTAILQKKYGNISTFSIGFNNKNFNEATFAKAIAEELGTRHHEFYIDITEVKDYLEKFYDIYDEPFYDTSGIPSAIISKMAADKGIKVVLSGDGGDELFAGYEHHATAQNEWSRYQKIPLRKWMARILQLLIQSGIPDRINVFNLGHRMGRLAEILSCKDFEAYFNTNRAVITRRKLRQLLAVQPGFEEQRFPTIKNDLDKLTYYDFKNYLPDDILVKMDRATMYSSIENREPLLDHRIAEFAFGLPSDYKIRNGVTKFILKDLLKTLIPPALFERPKKGFSVPMYGWLTNDLLYLCDKFFTKEYLQTVPELNSNAVLGEYRKFRQYAKRKKEYNFEIIWRLVSYFLWREKYDLQ